MANVQKEYANRKFVKRGIDSYKKEKNIWDAAESGDLETVQELVCGNSAELHKSEEIGYWTALHYAAKEGHLDVAQYLVEKGAAVNRKTKSGETPLHLAAMFGRPDLVRFLLVKGADYTLTNFHKLGTETIRHTPREVAVDYKFPEIVKIFDQFFIWEKKRAREETQLTELKERLEREKSELIAKRNPDASKLSEADFAALVSELKERQNTELIAFYATHKTQKPPPGLLPIPEPQDVKGVPA